MVNRLTLDGGLATLVSALADSVKDRPAAEVEGLLGARLTARDYHLLREGLERALASRDYLKLYLRHIDASLPRPSPYRKPLDPGVVEAVLQQGLQELAPGQLGLLALSPLDLLGLWDAISGEDELPGYWRGVVRSTMERDQQETGKPIPTLQQLSERAQAQAAGLLANHLAGVEEVAAAVDQSRGCLVYMPVRWTVSVSLRDAEWLSCDDAGEVARLTAGVVCVEFTWRGQVRSLEVRLVSGPMGLSGVEARADLVEAAGIALATALAQDGVFTFDLASVGAVEELRTLTLVCDYRRPGIYHLRFRAAVGSAMA
jgi:hypothetical protein